MPAGAGARDAKLVRFDIESGGIVPYESDSAMNILLDFRDEEPRLRAVYDCKHGVTAFQQSAIKDGIDRVVARKESAADHEENAASVRFLGLKCIERQRGAELAPVNHVFNPLQTALRRRLGRGGCSEKKGDPD